MTFLRQASKTFVIHLYTLGGYEYGEATEQLLNKDEALVQGTVYSGASTLTRLTRLGALQGLVNLAENVVSFGSNTGTFRLRAVAMDDQPEVWDEGDQLRILVGPYNRHAPTTEK